MLLETDDEIMHVNAEFLGPKDWTLPWRARYTAYGLGTGLLFLAVLVEGWLGFRLSFFGFAYTLVGVVGATRWLGRRVNYDYRVRDWAAIFWHELTAPRRDVTVRSGVLRPGKVRGAWTDKVIVRGA